MGYISGLPLRYEEESMHNRGLAIALFDKGIGQDVLDARCRKLSMECRIEEIEILITKGDYPFDRRWYIIGDIKTLLEKAKQGKMNLPFSDNMHEHIKGILERYA